MASNGIGHDIRLCIKPVGLVFIVMAASFAGYFGSRQVSSDGLPQGLALVFGTTYFLAVAFGPLYVFTAATLRSVSLPVRVLAVYINPLLWMTKEVLRLGKPLAPGAVAAVNDFVERWGGMPAEQLMAQYAEAGRHEADLCDRLIRTEHRRIGVNAVLTRSPAERVPVFE